MVIALRLGSTPPPIFAARAITTAALVQAALFLVLVARTAVLRPVRDMFSWIGAYLQRDSHAGWLAYLWQPHNEHHLALIRLLAAAAVTFCRGNGAPFVVAATSALLAAAWLLYAVWHVEPTPRRVLAPLAPMLLLTTPAAADCAIPVNAVYPLAVFFIVAAITLFDAQSERTPRTRWRRAAACAAAVLASLASGAGLVAIPALLWAAWRGGARNWIIPLGLSAAAYGALYVHGLPIHAALPTGPGDVLKMADYAIAFAGLPLARVPGCAVAARALGGLLIALGLAALIGDAVKRNDISRLHRVSLALIIAGLSAIALATAGRVDLASNIELPLRYALMVAPLHAGLLGWFVCTQRTIHAWAGCALTGMLLLLQVTTAPALIVASDTISAALDRYDGGARDPSMQQVIFPDLATADRITAALRHRD
jgi:hypothetical protein